MEFFRCGVGSSEPICDACAERCNTICNARTNSGGIKDKATKRAAANNKDKVMNVRGVKHKQLSAKKGKTYREVFGVSSESSPEKLTRENGTQLEEERSEGSGTDKTIKDNRVADDQGDVDNRSQPTPQPVAHCTVDCEGSTLWFASLQSGLSTQNPAPNPLKPAFHYDRERLEPWERGRSLGTGQLFTLVAPGLGNLRLCSTFLPRPPNGLLCPTGLGSNTQRLGRKRWRPGKKALTLCFHYQLPGVRRALAMPILVTGVPATAAKNPTDPAVHTADPPKCHGPSVRALPDLPNRAAAGPPGAAYVV